MVHTLSLSATSVTHRGDRKQQQDQIALLAHHSGDTCLLAVVADGMGGLSGGRKAARQVIMTAKQLFGRFDVHAGDPEDFLRGMVRQAHFAIDLTALSSEEQPHSTIAAFLVLPSGQCHWVHVGDSRIYHFRDGRLLCRSSDHSYVQGLIDKGQWAPEHALQHPKINVLTSCLGAKSLPKTSYQTIGPLQIGDALLCCTDGFWHYFSDAELAAALSTLPPRDCLELLVKQARDRADGRGDNLSAAAVKIGAA